jgi:hypothetical protein
MILGNIYFGGADQHKNMQTMTRETGYAWFTEEVQITT